MGAHQRSAADAQYGTVWKDEYAADVRQRRRDRTNGSGYFGRIQEEPVYQESERLLTIYFIFLFLLLFIIILSLVIIINNNNNKLNDSS